MYILGNGPSRKNIDITKLDDKIYACNAAYRDFTPDLLFAIDIRMQVEVVKSGYYIDNPVAVGEWNSLPIEHWDMMKMSMTDVFETRQPDDTHFTIQGNNRDGTDFLGFKEPNNIITYDHPEGRNLLCGMAALCYAMEQKEEKVYLIGFDALQKGEVENVYQGTDNYPDKYTQENGVFYSQRSQFLALLQRYPDCEVYFQNSLYDVEKVVYNKLNYYENCEEWVLGEGFIPPVPVQVNKMR